MKFLVFLVVIVFFGVQADVFPINPRIQGRIINGLNASEGQFPWQVVIMSKINNNIDTLCGGSLISNQWILTAAHCVKNLKNFKLQMGTVIFNSTEFPLIESNISYFHPNYDSLTLNNDVGLIYLPTSITFTDLIQPIKLPTLTQVNTTFFNFNSTVSGFGQTSDAISSTPEILQWTNLRIITNQECAEYYGNELVINSTVCARGISKRSPCTGDSGGPLIIYENTTWVQIGIISFVSYDGCELNKPSGFIRTASFLEWINEITGIELEN